MEEIGLEYKYKTRGTCSSEMIIELDGDIIKSVKIIGGCNGNTKGICALVQGMDTNEVIRRFKGIQCGFKATSCPDQLANALLAAQKQQANK
jgi:uncharacterized protein (TIGR03905 family)